MNVHLGSRSLRTFFGVAGGLGALLASACSSASARSGVWRPLDLVVAEARPRPPAGTREVRALLARLQDRGLSYQERSEAALELGGSTKATVVEALAGLLYEPAPTADGERFRAKCAEALAWCAHNKKGAAADALFRAIYSRNTHWREGYATARALLDSIGPAETLRRLYLKLVRSGREGEDVRRLYTALHWVAKHVRSYHSTAGRDKVWRDAADALARRLDGMSADDLTRMLTREPCREVLRETLGHAPRSRLGDVLLWRLGKGKPREREALARLFAPSIDQEDWYSHQDFLFGLDARRIRSLAEAAEKLSDRSAREITRLVDAVCYGHEEVWQGEATVAEALVDTLEEIGWPSDKDNRERIDAEGASPTLGGPGSLLYFSPWQHIDMHPVRFEDPMRHPYLGVVEDEQRPLWERDCFAHSLLHSRRLGGIGESEEFARAVETAFGACRGKSSGTQGVEWATKEDKGRKFFLASLAALSVETSPAEQRRIVAERFLAQGGPLIRVCLLRDLAEDAYVRLADGEPVWLAEQGLVALEMLAAGSDRWAEDYVDRTLNIASGLARELTPEDVLLFEEAAPENLERIVERWRSWLERFRELPVFEQAGKRARGEARVETPPRNGLALQADRAR